MNRKASTFFTVLITVIVTLAVTAVVVTFLFAKFNLPFEKLMKVVSVIKTSYVGEYNLDECEENAINAVLESIGDKYAVYYDEENARQTMQLIEGKYVGIGIEIFANTEKGYIEIISAYEDSPADKAGIISGDLIKSIDGREYTAMQMADAVSYMKGIGVEDSLASPITVTFIRNGAEHTVKLNREVINIYKVKSEIIDDICYIRYSGYTAESHNQFSEIIKNIDSNVKGIIVDVRNNPGGEFKSSIDMCDLFLDDEMILYTVDKKGNKTEYNAKKGMCKLPLAVIVNGSTASAAEIFAGSMQANKRAVIIGEKTYGKGVSQTVRYLNPFDEAEGAIKLTTCKNYTPDGRWINESIIPDISVVAPPVKGEIENDAAFKAAVNRLKKDIVSNEK